METILYSGMGVLFIIAFAWILTDSGKRNRESYRDPRHTKRVIK